MTVSDGVWVRTADAGATRALGGVIAAHLRPGDVVSLSGELGAGKTCLVQGVAAAVGVTDRVTSPTFVLVKQYRGSLPLVHVDVYRLDRLGDVLELGDEVFAADAVTLVEWGDAVRAAMPDDRLEVELLLAAPDVLDDTQRRIGLMGRGAWRERLAALADDCAPFTETTA